jgi:hypothetical protein
MNRKYHRWETWECFKNGFYGDFSVNGITPEDSKLLYADFLSDLKRFRKAMERVAIEWKNSSEHFLTNENINRVAWLGQASMCIETGVSSLHRGGFYLMSKEKQELANNEARKFLLEWIENYEKGKSIYKELGSSWLF